MMLPFFYLDKTFIYHILIYLSIYFNSSITNENAKVAIEFLRIQQFVWCVELWFALKKPVVVKPTQTMVGIDAGNSYVESSRLIWQ